MKRLKTTEADRRSTETYDAKMLAQGFKKSKLWVHTDDWDKLRAYAARLRKARARASE